MDVATPGVETPSKSPISIDQVEAYLKKDLSVAVSCLDAIYRDPDLLRSMAVFLHGRYMNATHSGDAPLKSKF